MSSDSFGARSTLEVSGRDYEVFRLDALQERFDVARLPYSIKVLLENVLRLEDGVSVSAADVEAIAGWDAAAEPSVEIPFQPARVLMQDFTGVPAVVDLAAMRDAMEEIGGDPAAINPLVDVDLVIDHSVQVDAFGNDARLRRQRRARLRAQPRALLVPQVGPAVLRQLPRRAAGDRDLPPGQPRAPGPGRLQPRERRRPARLPRHPGRHRLAHDDGQRPRRARLGRRRDRGRGGDAGPADLDAAAAGGRLQARRRAAGGGDRDRPRPHRDRDAARARRRLQVRRVLRPRAADPGPRRPGDARQHVAGVRLDLRDLPGRRRDPALPRPDRPPDRDDRAGRRLRPRAGDVPRRVDARTRSSPTCWSSTSARSCPASPGRNGRRTGCRSPQAKESFLEAMGEFDPEAAEQMGNGRDEAIEESFPASDPPAEDHDDERGKPRPAVSGAAGGDAERGSDDAIEVTLEDGTELRARPRPRRDRRDHQLHQHLQPERDGRRRPARPQRGRARARPQALGEDLAGAGLDRGHRLPRARRPDRVPRRAPVQPGRLRLHHLHRQLRAAGGGDLGGDRREGPGGLRGALRQPQLRGPDQPGREGQLPGQPAAGRRLRAGRADGHRPRHRAAGRGLRRRAGLPARRLAQRRGDQGGGRRLGRLGDVRPQLRRGLLRRRGLERGRGSRGRPLHLARLDLRAPAELLRADAGRPARGRADRRRPGAGRCSATRSPPTTSRPPGRSKSDSPAGQLADRAGCRAAATSTPTARAAATTR